MSLCSGVLNLVMNGIPSIPVYDIVGIDKTLF